jgi:hypothetical protein
MSIEKNEHELQALERHLRQLTRRAHVALFNSVTGALHGGLWGRGIVEGERARAFAPSEAERRFMKWLGITCEEVESEPDYAVVSVGWDDLSEFCRGDSTSAGPPALVVDLTPLGFGPCAALATDNEAVWKRAERLKIFGAFDLRTMWTQEEAEPGLEPAAQFNYRLSPLVAACASMALLSGSTL